MTTITNAQNLGFEHGELLARAQRTGEQVTLPRIYWTKRQYEQAYKLGKAIALSYANARDALEAARVTRR
jgi:hypothetical protein